MKKKIKNYSVNKKVIIKDILNFKKHFKSIKKCEKSHLYVVFNKILYNFN